MSDKKRSLWRVLRLPALVVFAVILYGYVFQVTDVNLDEIRSESRQVQLTRVIRELARPRLFHYERIDTPTEIPFAMPCGPELDVPTYGPDERHLVLDVECGDPGVVVHVQGVNFRQQLIGKALRLIANVIVISAYRAQHEFGNAGLGVGSNPIEDREFVSNGE